MGNQKKVLIRDESGAETEYGKALVISVDEKKKISANIIQMGGIDILRAAYALVATVDELGMMPMLKKLVEHETLETENIEIS